MFEDFFTTYTGIEPPEIYNDNHSLFQDNIDDNIFSFNLDVPTFKEDTMEYPGVINPFEESYQDVVSNNYDFSVQNPEILSNNQTFNNQDLLKLDIEDLLRQEGITKINGKDIKFGDKSIRTWGKQTSHHRRRDPHTGNASARDISIVNGTSKDYNDFRKILLGNQKVKKWMELKNWGIINEITPAILAQTKGTGKHFHFGPDIWARNTWKAWNDNPNSSIDTSFRYYSSKPKSNTSNKEFVQNLSRVYSKVLQEKGLNPAYIPILVAQDVAESGWGQHIVGTYNYGNITISSKNQSYKLHGDNNKYRNYSSVEEFVTDKIDKLSNKRYNFFNTFSPTSNISVAMQTLANRGYAPGNYSYGTNVEKVYKSVLKYLS